MGVSNAEVRQHNAIRPLNEKKDRADKESSVTAGTVATALESATSTGNSE